ncbi:tetravalentM protein [Moniliophthora roreri MCA 2997]|uniref:TetravalentM protein n=2 Tax=Moniliophthora roreri TaxID=221103 RepID=V2WPH2_MONRO|nr:tetravalentM protein [Moniliophthora roreri MCA 2997]KAI3619215.1 tetravalentM protein [Moniliophthora roreri]
MSMISEATDTTRSHDNEELTEADIKCSITRHMSKALIDLAQARDTNYQLKSFQNVLSLKPRPALRQRIENAEAGEIVEDDHPYAQALRHSLDQSYRKLEMKNSALSRHGETHADENPVLFHTDGQLLTQYLLEALDYIQTNRRSWNPKYAENQETRSREAFLEGDLDELLSRVADLEAHLPDMRVMAVIQTRVSGVQRQDIRTQATMQKVEQTFIKTEAELQKLKTRTELLMDLQHADQSRLGQIAEPQGRHTSTFEEAVCFAVDQSLAANASLRHHEDSMIQNIEIRQQKLLTKISEHQEALQAITNTVTPLARDMGIKSESLMDVCGD